MSAMSPERFENHFTCGREARVEGTEYRGEIVAVINEPVDGVQRVEIETDGGIVNTDKSRVEVL